MNDRSSHLSMPSDGELGDVRDVGRAAWGEVARRGADVFHVESLLYALPVLEAYLGRAATPTREESRRAALAALHVVQSVRALEHDWRTGAALDSPWKLLTELDPGPADEMRPARAALIDELRRLADALPRA